MKRLNGKSGCTVEVTLSVMGGTWKPIILFHLLQEKKRFMELSRAIPSVTQRMLTLQLRELEEAGIVLRTVYAEVPPRVDYALTPLGQTLKPVLLAMRDWGLFYTQARDGDHGQTLAPHPGQDGECSGAEELRRYETGAQEAVAPLAAQRAPRPAAR